VHVQLHHTVHCIESLCVLVCGFCVSRNSGRGGGNQKVYKASFTKWGTQSGWAFIRF